MVSPDGLFTVKAARVLSGKQLSSKLSQCLQFPNQHCSSPLLVSFSCWTYLKYVDEYIVPEHPGLPMTQGWRNFKVTQPGFLLQLVVFFSVGCVHLRRTPSNRKCSLFLLYVLEELQTCAPQNWPWGYYSYLSVEHWLHGLAPKPGSVSLPVTVYPKKYAHGFCFAVLCCGYTLTAFPISIRLTSLALWQSNDCPSASKATLMNMDKYFMWIHYERLHNHNKAKHNKTVCIFLGIYCTRALRVTVTVGGLVIYKCSYMINSDTVRLFWSSYTTAWW